MNRRAVLVDARLPSRARDRCRLRRNRSSGKPTLAIIRATLENIVAQRRVRDPHIHYLDGRSLYGDADHARLPCPTGCIGTVRHMP